jgi:hypothetical protein
MKSASTRRQSVGRSAAHRRTAKWIVAGKGAGQAAEKGAKPPLVGAQIAAVW